MAMPKVDHRYSSGLMDSARWEHFEPRDTDIIISTPYKAGTTWTQRICSILIFQSIELDQPLSRISPWLDQLVYPVEETIARYEAQTHRRFIKTHTPLSALPYFPNVTYLVCGRDPRDIFISMENHYANLDMTKFVNILAQNSDNVEAPPSLPDDFDERFKQWLTIGGFPWEDDGFPFWSAFHHLQSFWTYRELANIHFIHYADLRRDLEAEMRRIGALLEIETPEERWPEFVNAATFQEMKHNHEAIAPNADQAIWRDGSKFFNKGTSGQWRDLMSAERLALYEVVKAHPVEPSLAAWIDHE